jgi:putative ABC transport system permease protein
MSMGRARDSMSAVALRWMIGGEWRAYPGRAIVTALVIAVGVALGLAVHLINASALNEFARAVRTVHGDSDLQVQGVSAAGFDENLFPQLARLEGIEGASPVVMLTARAEGAGDDATLTLLGLDVLRAASVTPSLVGLHRDAAPRGSAEANAEGVDVPEGEDAFDPEGIFLSDGALEATGVGPGARFILEAGGQSAAFTVAGTLPGVTDGQRLAVIDIAEAQWRFRQVGRLQRVDLRLDEGANPARVEETIAGILPATAELVSPQSEARRGDSLSRAYRVNLDMLALMALLSGGFLVYSAQSLSVARRRPQFALLRVLGTKRKHMLAQVLAEGIAVGALGAAAGLALGLFLAHAALGIFGGDLGAGYFRGARPELIFAPSAAIVFFCLGIAAALAGSFLPARESAEAQPAVALKNLGDVVDPRARPSVALPIALLVAGAGASFLPPVWDLPLFGYLAIALMLAGGVAAMPLLARLFLAPMRRLRLRGALDLAVKRLWGAPSQAAIALCGIVASTSLVIAMAVMVSSFRGSVDEWLNEILSADVYLYVEGGGNFGLTPEEQQRLAATPGVASISFLRPTQLRLSPDLPPVVLIARPVDITRPPRLPLSGASLDAPSDTVPVWVSEAMVDLYGYDAGDRISLPVGSAADAGPRFFVAGVWRDYARQHGAIAIRSDDYTRLTGDALRSEGAITLSPGAAARDVIESARNNAGERLSGRLNFGLPGEIREAALRTFDRSFAVTYLLEAIAILVGLAGVAASFSAQVLARTKEFGMLRHLGVLRRQIILMLASEGALLGIVGVVAGIALGLAISQVLIHVVNPQSFHWTMETRLPLALFAFVAAALILSAAGTALLAGRRALSIDAVRAVREDW